MRFKQIVLSLTVVAALAAMAGCGSLPDDGPSAKVVQQHAGVEGPTGYALVNLDYRVAQTIAGVPAPAPVGLAQAGSDAPSDLIADGDILSIMVFEGGASPLFGRGSGLAAGTGLATPSQSQETFPRVTVDRDGSVTLPFAGRVAVEGLTANQAGVAIRAALKGRAVDPQVLVSIASSAKNSVSVLGEVRSAGRFPLASNNDRLLDVIAAAGGPTKPPADVKVVLVRGDQTFTTPLSLLLEDPAQNIQLAPHDQVRLMFHERKFSIFGAFGHVTENPITVEHTSLAAVISSNGGLDTYSADNSSVFVFRFERPDVAKALGVQAASTPKGVPLVYRLDMKDPNGFFFAQNFEMQPDDMVYVPRASSIGVKKFLDLVSVVTSVTYTAAVTGANVP